MLTFMFRIVSGSIKKEPSFLTLFEAANFLVFVVVQGQTKPTTALPDAHRPPWAFQPEACGALKANLFSTFTIPIRKILVGTISAIRRTIYR